MNAPTGDNKSRNYYPALGREPDTCRRKRHMSRMIAVTGFGEVAPRLRDHARHDWRPDRSRGRAHPDAGRAHSQHCPCEHEAASFEGAVDGRPEVIDNCGHPMNVDRPDAVNEALIAFLDDL